LPDDGLTPVARAGLWLGLAALAVAPIFAHPFRFPGSYDWRYFVASLEAARHSWVWFRQVPLWNPYACGGEVGLANPQSLAVSPLALASSVFITTLTDVFGFFSFLGLATVFMKYLVRAG